MNGELSIIMVPTTRCNLQCLHCFELHSNEVMTEGQLKVVMGRVADYCLERAVGGVTFYWQGGEILTLTPAWFERMDEIVKASFDRTPTTVTHRVQSNLISYRSEWAGVVRRLFGGSIGSSLDYPSLYRGFSNLRGQAFNETWRKYFRRARVDGIDVSVISVLNEGSLALGATDFLRYYADEVGLSSMQINYPFQIDHTGDDGASIFLKPEALGQFLVDLFDAWVDEDAGWSRKIRINPFCELMDVFSYAPQPSRCNCIWSGNCAESFFSIGPDGSVGLCDCWVTSVPSFRFGNLLHQPLEEIAASPARKKLRHRIDHILQTECADCPYLAVCFGGCIIRSYGRFGTLNHKDPYCEAYQSLFQRVLDHLRSGERTGGNHGQEARYGTPAPAEG